MPDTSIICDVLCWLGGAAVWAFNNLGAPILAGAVAGLIVPLVLRRETTPAEVLQHNREAKDLNEDFRRFMSDLSRQVEGVFREAEGQMNFKKMVKESLDRELEEEGKPPLDPSVGASSPDLATALEEMQNRHRWKKECAAAMEDALWRYRDEALRKRGKFLQLVEAEADRHDRYRARKGIEFPALKLDEEAREALDSWRERQPNPFDTGIPRLLPRHDVSAMEIVLMPFEKEAGLTWKAAKQAILDAAK